MKNGDSFYHLPCFFGLATLVHGYNNGFMATMVPPVPPPTLSDESPVQRVHFRLWQIVLTAITILVTGWFFTLGAIHGIIALLFAKHILVAILAMGLHLPPPKTPGPRQQG
ncbi:MAG TPA: hypothetical protein VNX28_08915 [Gemmataceae bacterium]|nr:hypothetical protein [Gemmataceae bacterium]